MCSSRPSSLSRNILQLLINREELNCGVGYDRTMFSMGIKRDFSAVDGLEQNPALEVVDAVKKPAYLLHGKYCRQFPAHRSRRQTEPVVDLPAADVPIKVGDAGKIRPA